ncbi:MAG: DNA-binding transcriptional regulator [Sedimentisphaerales bacterium]
MKYSKLKGGWSFYNEPRGQEQSLPPFSSWEVDGAIVRLNESEKAYRFLEKGIPTIVAREEKEISGVPNIVGDNVAVGEMAGRYLLEKGFKHFGYCGFNCSWSDARLRSFARTVEDAGCQISAYVPPKSPRRCSWPNELMRISKWLRSLPKPVAIMACNDDRGRHVIEACKIANVKIPYQAVVLGVDNDELFCELSDPPLSSIARDTEAAGFEAAAVLDALMSGNETECNRIIVHPTHVVVRLSSDILAIEDPQVAKALSFIQGHSRQHTQVEAVAQAVAMSRRNLHRRFVKALGRTVHEEIRRARVDRVVQMLLQTDRTVSQIAYELGWSSEKHIAREFKAVKGLTPLAFRRMHTR